VACLVCGDGGTQTAHTVESIGSERDKELASSSLESLSSHRTGARTAGGVQRS
jgi:hypothetical protein